MLCGPYSILADQRTTNRAHAPQWIFGFDPRDKTHATPIFTRLWCHPRTLLRRLNDGLPEILLHPPSYLSRTRRFIGTGDHTRTKDRELNKTRVNDRFCTPDPPNSQLSRADQESRVRDSASSLLQKTESRAYSRWISFPPCSVAVYLDSRHPLTTHRR